MEAGKHLPNDPNDESCLSDPVNGIYCPLAGKLSAVSHWRSAHYAVYARHH